MRPRVINRSRPAERTAAPGHPPTEYPREVEAKIEASATRRITWRLIPLLFLLYIVCFLDRTNVGFAALQMNRDLAFGPAVYGLGAGIFFLGYALFEIPSNLILARVGARTWLGRIAITWGALAVAMMFVRSAESFYVMRFLLGVAEAGFFPGVIYYLTQWFPERQRAKAMSRFMIAVPTAGALGGALGGGLLSLDGRLGLAGWQWLFLVEGIPAVILGLLAIGRLPNRPADAHWLPDHERQWLERRLADEAERRTRDARLSLRAALAASAVWWLAAPYFLMSFGMYALLLWLPTLIRELTQASNQGVALVMTLSGIAGALAMLAVGVLSDRSGERIRYAAGTMFIAAATCTLAAVTAHPLTAVVAVAIAASAGTAFLPVYWCIAPLILSDRHAAAAIALINSLANIGGFVGPTVLGVVRGSTGGFSGGLLTLAGVLLAAAILTLTLRRALARPQ